MNNNNNNIGIHIINVNRRTILFDGSGVENVFAVWLCIRYSYD